jgi:hypothetical protein
VKASRKAGLFAAVSERALIVLNPRLASVAQDGIKPQRASEKCRSGLNGSLQIIPTGCDGAMLARLPIDLVIGFEVFRNQLLRLDRR